MKINMDFLPRNDVVFTVMFLNKNLCEKTLEAILEENINLIDIVAESKNDLHKAALNSIYFDIRTQALDGRIITLDLQRKYIKDRVRNRTIYYACREIASQTVNKSKYEKLKNVVVSFILTEASLPSTADNKKVQLYDYKSGEKYSDLLTIHEVNIQHIDNNNSIELQILRDFFEIATQEDFDKFINKYGNNVLGKLLINNYLKAISNTSLLHNLGEEDKFMLRLSEEDRLEEREEGKKEGIEVGKKEGIEVGKKEVALNLLKNGIPIDVIINSTGLSKDEVTKLSLSIE